MYVHVYSEYTSYQRSCAGQRDLTTKSFGYMAHQHVGGPYDVRLTGVRLPVADAPLCGVRAVIWQLLRQLLKISALFLLLLQYCKFNIAISDVAQACKQLLAEGRLIEMKKRRSDYFQKMAVRHSSQGADDDPGVMPKLRLDFNRKEQGALMKYAQRVRSLYKCVLLSACCACASAHHALTHSHAYSLTRSLAPPHLLAHSSLSFRCVGVLAAAREQRVHGSRCRPGHARRHDEPASAQGHGGREDRQQV